jgi:D-alanyl-D-alanine carboxypeptidase/D-alanyl-D-alanine-endopeptidase (penicillin-binding protein 4)
MGGFQGCLVVEDGSKVIYGHNVAEALAPASTEKLLTAAAALTQLGPGFRYETDVVATAPPSGGSVDDLWLVGKGDPVLATPEYIAWLAQSPEVANFPATPMSALADALVAAGIRTVRNGIHGDDSRYDRTRYLPSWPALYQTQVDIGPLGALSVNEGLMTLTPKVVAASDPATFAASELARLLGLRGASVAGAADGTAPAGGVVVARIQSAPLATIVDEMLRISDNYTAELITRELDRHAGGAGSTPGGTSVIMRTAAGLGLPTAGLQMVDGSGLDHGDRSTCQLELAALDLGQRANLSQLSTGLAVAGVSGTLIHRYVGTPFQGHLEAKTGSIDGVMAMAGHEEVGHPLRFAMIVNGVFTWAQGAALEDRLVAALATYPEG